MADLSAKDTALAVTLVGSAPNGAETNYVNATADGELLAGFAPAAYDAFGRFRISSPKSLFDATFQYDKQPLLFSESVATGGTVTWNSNLASVDIATTTTNGSSAIFQSKQYIKYHPGKSNLILLTGNLGAAKTNNRRRIGQFDANNGYFFELNDTTLSVNLRSNVSGSPVDTKITQANWNLDKLDGTGASGITLNTSLQQIYIIDYQWLGSGRIRFGINISGKIIYCHQIVNANILSTPYSATAVLPLRLENTNTAATGSATSLFFTCCSVVSEGDYAPDGLLRRISNGTTAKTVGGTGTLVPIISLRKQAGFVNLPVKLLEMSVFVNSADDAEFVVYVNPTLTGASWASVPGLCERDVAATAVTGGTEVYGGYIRGNNGAPSIVTSVDIFNLANFVLGSDLAGNSDVITIALRNITSASTALAGIVYKELV
jgi:hypothetical protein